MRFVLTLLMCACAPRITEPKDPRSGGAGEQTQSSPSASFPKGPKATKQKLRLDGVAPNRAPLTGDVIVTLTGAGFVSPLAVAFGGEAAVEATVSSETEAVVVAPAAGAEGTFDVTVATDDGSESTKRAAFIYGGVQALGVQYCLLRAQNPLPNKAEARVLVYADGKTKGAGQGSDVIGELGYGAPGSSPAMYTFSNMEYVQDEDGINAGDKSNDVYAATLDVPPGDYQVAARFRTSADGDWLYCDLNGTPFELQQQTAMHVSVAFPQSCKLEFPVIAWSTEGKAVRFYASAQGESLSGRFLVDGAPLPATLADGKFVADIALDHAGDAVVRFEASADGGAHYRQCDLNGAASPWDLSTSTLNVRPVLDPIDYCVVQQQFLDSTAGSLPIVTVETYEAGVTDHAAAGNSLVVEAGYGGLGANPALGYSWHALPYKGHHDGAPNNYDYEGALATALTQGKFSVAARVRRSLAADWTYCDRDNSSMDFHLDQVTPLNVTP